MQQASKDTSASSVSKTQGRTGRDAVNLLIFLMT